MDQPTTPQLDVISANLVDDSSDAAKVSKLAGEISKLMALALRGSGLPLGDIVYAGGLGINGFARMAMKMVAECDMTEQEVTELNVKIVTDALRADMVVMKFKTVEEAEQFAADKLKAGTVVQ